MLTHIDEQNRPTMVDVSDKNPTLRVAVAEARITLPRDLAVTLQNGDIMAPKGPVFATAIIAGTMAVKKTSDLIPFCHPLAIEGCKIAVELINDGKEVPFAHIQCRVKTFGKTGVEMEALTGASAAALTIYDMCKAFGKEMIISDLRLTEKSGGKSDYHAR